MGFNGITTIHIEVARDICNIRCNFCYIDFAPGQSEPYDYASLKKVVEYCRTHDVECVTVQGGEITAIPEGLTFCQELQKLGITLNVMTNGVRLNDAWMDVFSQACHRVNVSINTPSPETYRTIIGFDGWKTVYNNIARINELRRTRNPNCEFSISTVLTKHTFHEVVDFYRMSRELNVDYVCLYPDVSSPQMPDMSNPTLRAKVKELYYELKALMESLAPIHPEDLVALQIYRDFAGIREELRIPTFRKTNGHVFGRNVTGMQRYTAPDRPDGKAYCKMPSSMVYINHEMDVFTCCGATGIKYGNLKTEELDQILENPKRENLQSRTREGDYSSCSPFCTLMPRN